SSAALADDRYVWIFGDTLLGTVRRDCPRGVVYCGRARVDDDPERAMIANSVGLMRMVRSGAPSVLVPYWRTRGGRPEPIFEDADPETFLWPLAVARVGHPLLVAASVHSRAMGLFSLGSVLVRVDNPDDAPGEWRYTLYPLPHTIQAGAGREQLSWATALVPLGPHVYLVGESGVGVGSTTVLARFAAAGLSGPAWPPRLEYLVGTGTDLRWTLAFDETQLYRLPGLPGTSETTFHRTRSGTWRTYRIPPGTFEIRRYSAASLLGPWTNDGVVASVPAPWSTARNPDGSFVYAAYAVKAHPELGTPERPVLTYNVNVTDGRFESAVRAATREPDFYVPQVLVPPREHE
ncbi:MAG TPA: hypothetical protein VNO26_14435, partial [Candidatus Limnocylindria bacterium]|nr:hypothetical protein [Candidatus Limnocylindria bacterium]